MLLRQHFPVVSWDRWLDQLQGVDMLVVDERGLAAGVALSTETTKSRDWSAVKDVRHSRPAIPIFEYYVDKHQYHSGAFWLHDPDVLLAGVREKLRENITKVTPDRYLLTDVDGNRFDVRDLRELDSTSKSFLLRYL